VTKRTTEALFLTGLSVYLILDYLSTTTFEVWVPDFVMTILRGLFLFLAFTRLYLFKAAMPRTTVLTVAVFTGLGFYYYMARGDTYVIDMALIVAAATGVSFKRIGALYLYIGAFISLLALICSQTGIIIDYTYFSYRNDIASVRHSLGIIYPTDCFAHVFYLMLIYLIVRFRRITYIELAGLSVITGVFYYFTGARADLACAVAVLVLCVICKALKYKEIRLPEAVKYIFACCPGVLCSALILTLSKIYNPNDAHMHTINTILSDRLYYGMTGFNLYGFTPFGSESFAENGSSNGGISQASYVFYDSSYVKFLFKYGWVLLLVLLVVLTLISVRFVKNKMFYGVIFLAAVALSCMIEHHMLELSYNITFLLLTADISTILQTEAGKPIKAYR